MLGEKVPHQHIAIHTGHTEFFVCGFVFFKFVREKCVFFETSSQKIVWENPVGSNSLPNKNKTTCYFWLETEPPCEPINKYTISFKFHFLKLEGQVRIFVRKILVVLVIVFARGQNSTQQKKNHMNIRTLPFPVLPRKLTCPKKNSGVGRILSFWKLCSPPFHFIWGPGWDTEVRMKKGGKWWKHCKFLPMQSKTSLSSLNCQSYLEMVPFSVTCSFNPQKIRGFQGGSKKPLEAGL